MMKIFAEQKRWYKGNLHTHTTESDGKLSLLECQEAYKKQGYDFLCITDHRKYYAGQAADDFIVLPGTEFHYHDMAVRKAFHITGLNIKHEIPTDDSSTPQDVIGKIAEAGGLAVMAHPAWSLLTHEDIMGLENLVALEVYNTVSEVYSCRGYSDNYADVLASKGHVLHLLAVDDAHFYDKDAFKGWIMLQSDAFSSDSIAESIRRGKNYSSQGPAFLQITKSDGFILVESSPVASISFISDTFYARERIVEKDGLISKASYKIMETDNFVRVELADASGKKAWSNFIRVK